MKVIIILSLHQQSAVLLTKFGSQKALFIMCDLCWTLTSVKVIATLSLHHRLFRPNLVVIANSLPHLTTDLAPVSDHAPSSKLIPSPNFPLQDLSGVQIWWQSVLKWRSSSVTYKHTPTTTMYNTGCPRMFYTVFQKNIKNIKSTMKLIIILVIEFLICDLPTVKISFTYLYPLRCDMVSLKIDE